VEAKWPEIRHKQRIGYRNVVVAVDNERKARLLRLTKIPPEMPDRA
jgi:hypothetical protein